jgi:hypothetical protein
LLAVEQVANQAPGHWLDRHRTRLRRCQQARRQVRDVADHLVVSQFVGLDVITDDDHARRDADPAPHRPVRTGSQGPDSRTQVEACADRPFGIVLVRLGVTEQDAHVIRKTASNEPFVTVARLRDTALKVPDRMAQVFKVHAVGSSSSAKTS